MASQPQTAPRAQRCAAPRRDGPQGAAPRRKRRFPYRKVDDLEGEIATIETRLAALEVDLASPELYRDGQRVKATREEFDTLQARLAGLYEHWEEALELN
jgi:ATP-binding cassette subfamily F protein 3